MQYYVLCNIKFNHFSETSKRYTFTKKIAMFLNKVLDTCLLITMHGSNFYVKYRMFAVGKIYIV